MLGRGPPSGAWVGVHARTFKVPGVCGLAIFSPCCKVFVLAIILPGAIRHPEIPLKAENSLSDLDDVGKNLFLIFWAFTNSVVENQLAGIPQIGGCLGFIHFIEHRHIIQMCKIL